ncbi:hypothetical protein F5880DRAFT_830479 [Lentinula raphanica]|nr:hypothetical protein F5880DRAFT_830479 [Lentinula raphanica]
MFALVEVRTIFRPDPQIALAFFLPCWLFESALLVKDSFSTFKFSLLVIFTLLVEGMSLSRLFHCFYCEASY